MAILKDLIVNGAARFIGDAYFNTIKSGTWNGNAISVTYGGTGLTSVASNKVLVGQGSATLTTRDIVTSVTSGGTGLVTSGAVYTALNANLASYVTLGTNQTISGEKTFNSDVLFESGAKLVMTNFNVNYTASDINNTISGTMVSHSVDSNQYSITLLSSASSSYGTQLVFDDNGFVSVPKLRVGGVDSLGYTTYQPLCLNNGQFATLNTLNNMALNGTCVASGTLKITGTFQTKGVNLLNSSGQAMSGKHILLGNGSYISEDSNAPANISDSYYVLGKFGTSGTPSWYKGPATPSIVTYAVDGLTPAPSITGHYTGSDESGYLQPGQYVLSSSGLSDVMWRPINTNALGIPSKQDTATIPFGKVDATSTSTVFTATVPNITELKDGVSCYLMNGVVTSAANWTLNVNGLGAKPVYQTLAAATRTSTLFNIDYTMLFVYNSTRVSGGCWDIFYGYNSDNNTIGYNIADSNTGAKKVKTACQRYQFLLTTMDGLLLPVYSGKYTTATTKTLTTEKFNPFGQIYYYNTTTALAANDNLPSGILLSQATYTRPYLAYAFNTGNTLVAGDDVYLVCVPQDDGTAVLHNNPIAFALPTTEDGLLYKRLGKCSDEDQIILEQDKPVYYYKDGAIRLWTNSGYDTSSIEITSTTPSIFDSNTIYFITQ